MLEMPTIGLGQLGYIAVFRVRFIRAIVCYHGRPEVVMSVDLVWSWSETHDLKLFNSTQCLECSRVGRERNVTRFCLSLPKGITGHLIMG